MALYVDGYVLPVKADPRIARMDPASMPIDGKRMFWGGFKELVGLSA